VVHRDGKQVQRPPAGAIVLRISHINIASEKQASLWVWLVRGPMTIAGCRQYFRRCQSGWRRREPTTNDDLECAVS
jgi:hypothetical protein